MEPFLALGACVRDGRGCGLCPAAPPLPSQLEQVQPEHRPCQGPGDARMDAPRMRGVALRIARAVAAGERPAPFSMRDGRLLRLVRGAGRLPEAAVAEALAEALHGAASGRLGRERAFLVGEAERAAAELGSAAAGGARGAHLCPLHACTL